MAEDDRGEIIATVAVTCLDYPPAYTNSIGRRGFIANMYTADEYRGQGIAAALIHMMDEEAVNGGVPKPILHTSATGGKAYAKSEANEADVVMENDPE